MAGSIFTFGGAGTRRPTVRFVLDDTNLNSFSTGVLRVVALLGTAQGSQPGVPILWNTPTTALLVLRGGDLFEAIRYVYAPSAEVLGASLVYTVRIAGSGAAKATVTIDDAAAVDSIKIDARNWGALDNQIQVKVENGSDQVTYPSGKKVTVSQGENVYFKDNIYRAAFSLRYTGAGTACTVTTTATALSTTATGATGDSITSMAFATYTTLDSLIAAINTFASGVYTAVLLSPDGGDSPAEMGQVTTLDIKTAPGQTLTLIRKAITDWLNTDAQPLVVASKPAAAKTFPANITTYLAGGADGSAPTAANWQAGLDALTTLNVSLITPLSFDPAIHDKTKLHVETVSADGRRPRRAFVGGALGEYTTTLTTILARPRAINSDRVAFLGQGAKLYNSAGVLTTFSPPFMAALICGMQAGLPEIGEPLTFKQVGVTGLEWVPTGAELELLIEGGVLPVEYVETRGFFRVVRGISTWLKSDAYNRVEISTGDCLDEVIRRVVSDLEKYIGRKSSPLMVHLLASQTETTLIGLMRDNIIVGEPPGRNAGAIGTPAYQNISVQLTGDTAYVEFECSPAIPLNFIGVTIHANVFSGSIRIAVRAV
jgi:hypothetical protein